jgi:hypothetical protein
MKEYKIACPHCEWEPEAHSRWICEKCPTLWNTFDTYGKCPSCGHVHRYTQCLRCQKISPHHKWYKDLGDVDISELKETEKVEVGK